MASNEPTKINVIEGKLDEVDGLLKGIQGLLKKKDWTEDEIDEYGNKESLRLKEHDLNQEKNNLSQEKLILLQVMLIQLTPAGKYRFFPIKFIVCRV